MIRKAICKLGLLLCSWAIPRLRNNPDISYAEYNEAITLQQRFTEALTKLNK